MSEEQAPAPGNDPARVRGVGPGPHDSREPLLTPRPPRSAALELEPAGPGVAVLYWIVLAAGVLGALLLLGVRTNAVIPLLLGLGGVAALAVVTTALIRFHGGWTPHRAVSTVIAALLGLVAPVAVSLALLLLLFAVSPGHGGP